MGEWTADRVIGALEAAGGVWSKNRQGWVIPPAGWIPGRPSDPATRPYAETGIMFSLEQVCEMTQDTGDHVLELLSHRQAWRRAIEEVIHE